MIKTVNHGPSVISSTYWESDLAERGMYFLSLNAGSFRLLCPPGEGKQIAEMRTSNEVVITIGTVTRNGLPGMQIGREMVEILFDDRTDRPFNLTLSMEQLDRRPPKTDDSKRWEFSAWEGRRGKPHQALYRRAYLRFASLPCLKLIIPE
jgi:hypothetical protein